MICPECKSEMLRDESFGAYACIVCCSSVVTLSEYSAERRSRMSEAARRAGYLEELSRKMAGVCGE